MNFVIGRCLRLCGYAIEIQAGEVDWNAWNSAGGGARGSAAAGEQTAATVLSVNPTVNRRERPGDSSALERVLTLSVMNPKKTSVSSFICQVYLQNWHYK